MCSFLYKNVKFYTLSVTFISFYLLSSIFIFGFFVFSIKESHKGKWRLKPDFGLLVVGLETFSLIVDFYNGLQKHIMALVGKV